MRADIHDFRALRGAFEGMEVVFHTAGYVGSRPTDWAWRVNAEGPLLAVEAAAAAGCRRVVVTSSISAVGLPSNERPADEQTRYPNEWLGLTYPDSKHQGERVALDAAGRDGVEVVVVNPGYVLGVPRDRAQANEASARTVGNYLRGRSSRPSISHRPGSELLLLSRVDADGGLREARVAPLPSPAKNVKSPAVGSDAVDLSPNQG